MDVGRSTARVGLANGHAGQILRRAYRRGTRQEGEAGQGQAGEDGAQHGDLRDTAGDCTRPWCLQPLPEVYFLRLVRARPSFLRNAVLLSLSYQEMDDSWQPACCFGLLGWRWT